MRIDESHNLSGSVLDEAGNQVVMMQMGYGERVMNLYAEIVDEAYVAEHAEAVRGEAKAFLEAAFERAAQEFAALPRAAEVGG